MRALLELVGRRAKGRVVKWLRLVKQPKYFIGLGVGLAYYGWLLFGRVITGGHRPNLPLDSAGTPEIEGLRLLAGAGVAAFLTLGFLWPGRQPLSFDESEIQYLFTAPIGRRSLIRYALLKFQPGILIGSFVSVMLLGRGAWTERALHWPGVWALFTAWFLWSTAVGLFKARTNELPRRDAWRRRLLSWGALAAYWSTLAVAAFLAWQSAVGPAGGNLGAALRHAATRFHASPILHVLLAPFEAPFLALWPTSGAELALGWACLAVLIAVLSETCARSPVLFEDDAIDRARKLSDIRSNGVGAVRTKASAKSRKQAPFRLGPIGRPEIAVVWKNLMMVRRRPIARTAAWVVGILAALLLASVAFGAPPVPLSLCLLAGLGLALGLTLSAGAAWRNDLRVDLLHVDQLRTWPIDSRSLLAAEIASPALAASFSVGACVLLAALAPASALLAAALGRSAEAPRALENVLAALDVSGAGLVIFGTLAVFIVAVALTFLSCALQNTSVMLFPGWARLGPSRPQGAAVLGQQVLLGVGRLVAMAVGILPGAIATTLLVVAHGAFDIPFFAVELPIFALILAAPLFVEAWLLTLWCARLWDQLDPSRDLLEPSSD